MKGFIVCFLSLMLLAAATARAADPEKPKSDAETPKSSVLMKKKLEYSQELLKALMTQDYDEAERYVRLMKTFTRLEELYRGSRPGYQAQFKKFQESVDKLSQSIDDKNIDGASEAYVGMIQSCIHCHKTLKD